MAENITAAAAIKSSPLKKTTFKSFQELFDAFAEGLILSFDAIAPLKGDKGDPGDTLTKTVKEVDVPAAAASVDVEVDCEDAIVNLTNSVDAAPTVGISVLRGTRVYFTAATPTANYKVRVITYNIKTEETEEEEE